MSKWNIFSLANMLSIFLSHNFSFNYKHMLVALIILIAINHDVCQTTLAAHFSLIITNSLVYR